MKRQKHWLKGDCHLHTSNSDGKYSPEELYDMLFERGVDFAFITDHNVNSPGRKAFNHRGVAIFPGMEISGNLGHVNIWGENLPFDRIDRPDTPEAYGVLLDKARSSGAHISVNHPLDRKLSWKLNIDSTEMDSVEVWNSPMHTDNVYCLEWWASKILEGKYIPAVGGSDYHTDYAVTHLLCVPLTYVYAESNSLEDILAAIKRGNVFVTNSPSASPIYLTSGEAVPGDSVDFSESKSVNIRLDELKKGYILRIYHNEKIIFEYKAEKTEKNFEREIQIPSEGFVRADVKYTYPAFAKVIYRKIAGEKMGVHDKDEPIPDMIYSFTNPIFFV